MPLTAYQQKELDRLRDLETRRTDGNGNALKGYKGNVSLVRALIADLEEKAQDPNPDAADE